VRRVKHLAIDVGIKKGKTKIELLGNRWSSEEPPWLTAEVGHRVS